MRVETTFRRVRTLQPDVTDEYFNDDVQTVIHRQTLRDLRLAISCWEPPRDQFSAFFLDELTVEQAVRQIVTAVTVKTQKVRCEIVHESMPYDDGELFDDPLPENLRDLQESEFHLNFPLDDLQQREAVLAGEFLSLCSICDGSGRLECVACSGTGTQTCKRCDGAGKRKCNQCRGAGDVMVSQTATQQCSSCHGNGTQNCQLCKGAGVEKCKAAECRAGTVGCTACNANGMMRNRTFLLKQTFVKVSHHLYCKNDWVDATSELATDLAILRHQDISGSGADVKIEELRRALPENLRQDAVRLCRGMVQKATNDSWDLGTRFELRAGYVYHVVVEHLDQQSELFVSGCSNTITLFKSPPQPKGWSKKLGRGVGAFLNPSQVKNSDHIEAMRAGQAFLSDERLIGPALRQAGLEISLNPDGYDAVVRSAPTGFELAKVSFHFDAGGNITLHCSVLLGDADRDCFPEALMLCNELSIGQIALREFSAGTREQFLLVNRQPYATASPPHLAFLLQRLLTTAYQIRKSKRIGLSLPVVRAI